MNSIYLLCKKLRLLPREQQQQRMYGAVFFSPYPQPFPFIPRAMLVVAFRELSCSLWKLGSKVRVWDKKTNNNKGSPAAILLKAGWWSQEGRKERERIIGMSGYLLRAEDVQRSRDHFCPSRSKVETYSTNRYVEFLLNVQSCSKLQSSLDLSYQTSITVSILI